MSEAAWSFTQCCGQGIGLAIVAALFLRDWIDVRMRHDRNPVFVTSAGGSIRNACEVFGTMIAANLTMLFAATGSFPGRVAGNSAARDGAAPPAFKGDARMARLSLGPVVARAGLRTAEIPSFTVVDRRSMARSR